MRKELTFFILFCLMVFFAHAQELSSTVISAQGNYSQEQNIALEWTIGETFIEFAPTRSLLFTQGFHQPTAPFFNNGSESHDNLSESSMSSGGQFGNTYQIDVYPNPFFNQLNVKFNQAYKDQFIIRLLDLNGMILQEVYPPEDNPIVTLDVSHLPAAVYMLSVFNQTTQKTQVHRVFKFN